MPFSPPRTWVLDEVVTDAHMNQEVRDNLNAVVPDGVAAVDWAPVLEASTTNPSTLSVSGRRWRVGPIQFVAARWVLSTGGSGSYFVTLPVSAVGVIGDPGAGMGQVVGAFHARDLDPAWMLQGSILLASADTVVFHGSSVEGAAGGGIASGVLQHNSPRTWASGDVFSMNAWYPVA